MKKTNIKCPACGQYLVDIAGLGEKEQKLICNNPSCPSHYSHISCPKCGSTDKKVIVLGLGHQVFHCNKCGNEWDSLQEK